MQVSISKEILEYMRAAFVNALYADAGSSYCFPMSGLCAIEIVSWNF